MSITLIQGLTDLSKELGESITNTTTRRIAHYNDAVQEFANERKWKFLLKENTDLNTGDGASAIDISGITDIRMPGGIKEILIGDSDTPILPVEYKDRNTVGSYNRFYISPDEQELHFTKEVDTSETLTILYYYIPARITETTSSDTFPIPSRYRKALGTLGAAFVQWSRYLDGQGNRLLNIYNRLLEKIEANQSEHNDGMTRKIPNPRAWAGYSRTYRNGSRVR